MKLLKHYSDTIDTSVRLLYCTCLFMKSLLDVCFAGSVVYSAAREGDGTRGTFRQRKELLCESAGKLLCSSARPGAAGWKASANPQARLLTLHGESSDHQHLQNLQEGQINLSLEHFF